MTLGGVAELGGFGFWPDNPAAKEQVQGNDT
jgi:hypothetical protein